MGDLKRGGGEASKCLCDLGNEVKRMQPWEVPAEKDHAGRSLRKWSLEHDHLPKRRFRRTWMCGGSNMTLSRVQFCPKLTGSIGRT